MLDDQKSVGISRKAWTRIAVFAAAMFGFPLAAGADTVCKNVVAKRVSFDAWTLNSRSCDDPGDRPCHAVWQAWLYTSPIFQPVAHDSPAIVFLHGHIDNQVGEPCAIAEAFTARGFVVLAPLQRGEMADPAHWGTTQHPMRSTGMKFDDYVASPACTNADKAYCKLDYLAEEVSDVSAAIAWLIAQPSASPLFPNAALVDASKVAIMGHSNGGQLAVLSNAADLGQSATIAISPAIGHWDLSPAYSQRLGAAAADAAMPLYVFQNKNEGSIQPAGVLSSRAMRAPHRAMGAMFPSVNTDDPHSDFIRLDDQVARWIPSVMTFLETFTPL